MFVQLNKIKVVSDAGRKGKQSDLLLLSQRLVFVFVWMSAPFVKSFNKD